MTDPDQATLVRLATMESLLRDHGDRLTVIERKDAVAQVHQDNVETRLSSIEDTLKWLARLIMGSLLMAAIGFALSGGFNP